LRWRGRGFTKLSFTTADFEDGEMRPDIPLNAVDRHVGNRMRERRTYLRMTEEHLAELIGVRPLDIWAFEAGKTRIGFDALRAVAAALRVSERYFYKGFGQARDVVVSA
jgi:DNA-binding XRE family transcriptional regulator